MKKRMFSLQILLLIAGLFLSCGGGIKGAFDAPELSGNELNTFLNTAVRFDPVDQKSTVNDVFYSGNLKGGFVASKPRKLGTRDKNVFYAIVIDREGSAADEESTVISLTQRVDGLRLEGVSKRTKAAVSASYNGINEITPVLLDLYPVGYFTHVLENAGIAEQRRAEQSSGGTSQSVSVTNTSGNINYAEYSNYIPASQLSELLTNASNGSKWSIGLSVLSKTNNTWRVHNGGQYTDLTVPAKLSSTYNANENAYLFLVDVSARNNNRTLNVVDIIPFTAMGIPNTNNTDILKLRTPRDFDIEGFFHEYLVNKNNPGWVSPIKMVPDVSNTRYGKYLRRLGGSSLANAEDGATGYYVFEGVNQYTVREAGNDGSGWFPLRVWDTNYYFKESDRETLLKREYADSGDGLLLLIRKVKGSGSRADRVEVDHIFLLRDLEMSYRNTSNVDVEMKVAEYFLRID